MEVYKFYLTNETNRSKIVIVEPIHIVEESLKPNEEFELHFSSASKLENRDLFSIEIKEDAFVITINWNMSEPASRSIKTFVNEVETFKFEF